MWLPMDARYLMRRQCEAVEHLWRVWGGGSQRRCLDLGCAAGDAHGFLMKSFPVVVGVDVDAAALRRASGSKVAGRSLVLTGGWADDAGISYPFAAGTFDAVVSVSLLHHRGATGRRAVAREAARLVRPGGLVVFFEYNPWNPLALLTVALGPDDRESRPLLAGRARSLLEAAGLRVVAADYLLFFPRTLAALAPLEDRLRRFPFGGKYVVAGVKP